MGSQAWHVPPAQGGGRHEWGHLRSAPPAPRPSSAAQLALPGQVNVFALFYGCLVGFKSSFCTGKWQKHKQSPGGGPAPRRSHRAVLRATAWPAGNGLGLLLVEPGTGPARRVGAGGDGLWCAGDETFVVERVSAVSCQHQQPPPEPEQGVPAAPAPLCPPGSQPSAFCPPEVLATARAGCPSPTSPSWASRDLADLLAPSHPCFCRQLPATPRSVPHFPPPPRKSRENDRYLCLARTRQ